MNICLADEDIRIGQRHLALAKGEGRRPARDDELPFCRSSAKSFRRGDMISAAGTFIDSFARVEKGVVTGSTNLADGRHFIIEIIPKGGYIGDLEVLSRQPHNLEYRAAADCELHYYDGRLLRGECARNPKFSEKILSKALARVAELEMRIISNAGSSLQSRLASTLLRLARVYGRPGSGFEVMISQNDLAATLPASREKVNQCLRRLRESKIIAQAQGRGRIRILDLDALEAFADSASS